MALWISRIGWDIFLKNEGDHRNCTTVAVQGSGFWQRTIGQIGRSINDRSAVCGPVVCDPLSEVHHRSSTATAAETTAGTRWCSEILQAVGECKKEISLQYSILLVHYKVWRNCSYKTLVLLQQVKYRQLQFTGPVLQELLSKTGIP